MRRLSVLPILLVAGALALAFASNGVLGPVGEGPRQVRSADAPAEPPILVGTGRAWDDPPSTPGTAPRPPPVTAVVVEDPDRCTEPPPDPIEAGPCRLIVSATDERAEAFSGQIDLWRLAAPGNDQWMAGDQRQARIASEHGRYVFDDLPPGRYRIHAHEQRKDSEDPPAFVVAGDLTEIAFTLPGRRKHRVAFKIYDGTGRQVEVARLRSRSPTDSYVHPGRPAWATHRAR
jgi:hypothetical protein